MEKTHLGFSVEPEHAELAARALSRVRGWSVTKVQPGVFYQSLADKADNVKDWRLEMIGRVEVNRDVIEAVCRLLSKIKRRGFAKGELLQSSGATGFGPQRSFIE